VAADGSFTFSGVAPGNYTIAVRGMPAAAARAVPRTAGPMQMTHYALTEIAVDGQDLSGVSLTLQPGLTISGRIVFEGTSQTADLTRVRVHLTPVQASNEVSISGGMTQVEASGRFTIQGVAPGRYRLMGALATARPTTAVWQLKSSLVNGREASDLPIDVQASTDDVVITLTDRISELSGTVHDGAGQPTPDYQVIVFAADKAYWSARTRIRSVKPAADGKYIVQSVPPGEYLMAAVADADPDEVYDPAFLEQLSRSAIRISIAEGEKKTQDLRIGAQLP
jgi:hypothetical protein